MHNAEGRLAEACTGGSGNCGGTLTTDLGFSYSPRGEVTDTYESTPHSSGYYHSSATYWANGLLDQLSGPGGMPAITYAPDGEGRISTVSAAGGNPVTSTSYNVFGEPVGVTLGSGDSDAFQYDANTGRMTQYKYTVNGSNVTGNLTWNANGTLNKLQITDPFDSSNQQTCAYTYDDLARVYKGNCGGIWNQTFTFDPFGNVTKSGTRAFSPTYSESTNRMTYLGGSNPTYDANGNLTYDTYNNYAWDAENNLVTETPVGQGAVSRTYDALGRTVEVSSPPYAAFIYDPLGEKQFFMIGQTFLQGRATLPGGEIAQYGPGPAIVGYWHMDWEGTARLESTPSRTVSLDSAFGPYGEQYAAIGSPIWVLAFAGTQANVLYGTYDSDTRRYNPIQGRWLSPDPAGIAAVDLTNPQSLNRYAYVMNNPTTLTDPFGLQGQCTPGAPNCPPPVSCGNMVCADNPATFNGLPWKGWNIDASGPDPFGLQLYTACNSEGCSTGLDFNGASVANSLGLAQGPNQTSNRFSMQVAQWKGVRQQFQSCQDAPPMLGSAPNPYSLTDTYRAINAQAMFKNGGDGPWGQDVRGCLACMHAQGADVNGSHWACYAHGFEETNLAQGLSGFAKAVVTGGETLFSQLQFTVGPPVWVVVYLPFPQR